MNFSQRVAQPKTTAIIVAATAVLALALTGCSKESQFRSGCEAGEPLKCYYLGDLYSKGNEVKKDDAQAATYIERSCNGGIEWACTRIGDMYEKGVGVQPNPEQAVAYYLQACDKGEDEACKKAFTLYTRLCQEGDTFGCDGLADLHASGRGTERDGDHAIDLARRTCIKKSAAGCERLQKACNANDFVACTHLAELNEQGAGMPKDATAATALYTKACDRDHTPACEGLVRMLGTACKRGELAVCLQVGEMHIVGPKKLRDEDRALSFYQDACRGGLDGGCERSVNLLEKRCESGKNEVCVQLADMYKNGINTKKSPNRAVVLYQKACTNGSMKACTDLGDIYETGVGASKNPTKATELFEHACTNEYAIACARVATGYRNACDKGSADACYALARIVEYGNGVMKNEQQSAMLYSKACKGGQINACVSFAKMYEDGRGLPQDTKRAAAMYQTACDGGLKSACGDARRLGGGPPSDNPGGSVIVVPVP